MRPRSTALVAAVAALALAAPAQAVASSTGRTDRGPTPRAVVLDRAGHGAKVVAALGDRLPAAAATNRMSATRLRQILETDPTAWIGSDGQLFYKEKAETLSAATASASTLPALAAYPASQTFGLHSLPGSTHTIFLDFNGANVSGTWWNANGGMPARTYSGFTLDADPTTFNSSELAYIQEVWRIVAEKYAPFDVDVTTQDPGPGGYDRNGLLDLTYGDHVIITDDPTAVNSACGGGCSGIALLDTFDDTWRTDDYLEPTWVFSSKTSGSPILTAHTVAHEVGHTFGLTHDGDTLGTSGHEYSGGHGNWFPLMGSSARAIGQFSKGEYAGANNTQDDLAVIAAGGAPLRLDDHSDLMLTAEALGTGSVVGGVIGTRNDVDVFAVHHDCTTNLTASATGIGAGAEPGRQPDDHGCQRHRRRQRRPGVRAGRLVLALRADRHGRQRHRPGRERDLLRPHRRRRPRRPGQQRLLRLRQPRVSTSWRSATATGPCRRSRRCPPRTRQPRPAARRHRRRPGSDRPSPATRVTGRRPRRAGRPRRAPAAHRSSATG